MAAHSIVPPSSAGVTIHCPLSVLMRLTYPETEESEDSKQGTAAHEVGAKMIEAYSKAGLNFPTMEKTVNTFAENGELITEEIYEGGKVYADEVNRVMQETYAFNPAIEQKVACPSIHPESWGTPDCRLFSSRTLTLYIWDFKFGRKFVSEYENWQLINYFSGIFDQLRLKGLGDENIRVMLGVVQPRAYGRGGIIRYWEVKASDLRGYINRLHTATHRALNGETTAVTGSHCYRCPGFHACEPAKQAGFTLYEAATRTMPFPVSPDVIGVQLSIVERALEQLEELKVSLSQQAEAYLRQGKSVTNYTLEPTKGRLAWTASKEEVITKAKEFNVSVEKTDLITPTQAITNKMPADEVKKLAKRPDKGLKLVPIDKTKAKRIFSNVN